MLLINQFNRLRWVLLKYDIKLSTLWFTLLGWERLDFWIK